MIRWANIVGAQCKGTHAQHGDIHRSCVYVNVNSMAQ